jgi:hypothetical protein
MRYVPQPMEARRRGVRDAMSIYKGGVIKGCMVWDEKRRSLLGKAIVYMLLSCSI